MRDWMEYCNYPKGSSLSDLRAANGAPEPFNVKYWGVGNENWGCGGQMNGDEYATLYRRFSNYARPFSETRPFLVACGPSGNNQDWTRKFWGNMGTRRLFQQITMRSAVAAALGLNVIHRQAGKLAMTNIAQIVNVLHSMLIADGPQCVRTTTYYVYQMTKAHLLQTSIAVAVEKPEPVGLSVSASRRGGELTLTLVNPKPDAGMTVNCSLEGASARSATARMRHHPDLNAANTFATPDRIAPRDHQIAVQGARLVTDLPPLSVVTAIVKLA